MSESLIKIIDEGLSQYYKKFNRSYYDENNKGKFRDFLEMNDMEDVLVDELEAEDSTLVEFDSDFPLETDIDDEDEKNAEILSILNNIAYQRVKYQLDVSICSNIDEEYIKKVAIKYEKQMPSTLHSEQDKALMYYFAVGTKERFPFLTYLIDSYTKDRAKIYLQKQQSISIEEWAARSKFVQKLKKQHPQKAVKLTQAMANYTKRTLQQLKFTTTFKINDDLKPITEHVVAVSQFIVRSLMDVMEVLPPFQVDLIVALKGVISTVSDEQDEDDEKDEYNVDIGDIKERLKDIPAYHAIQSPRAESESSVNVKTITRKIENAFRYFQANIVTKKDSKFVSKTYPQNRRLSMFLDRRTEKEELTLFHPPNDCNEIPKDSVPEIGFEFVRNCLIPSQDKNENISVLSGSGPQLLTFMFNVEQRDQLRCYVIWNSQSMRFEGSHITEVLPILFKDTEANKTFLKNKNNAVLKTLFDKAIQDQRFEDVYDELTICA